MKLKQYQSHNSASLSSLMLLTYLPYDLHAAIAAQKKAVTCLGSQKQDKELFHCHTDAVEQLDSLTAAE